MKCPKCKSNDIVKRGKRHNKSGVKQLYLCKKCNLTFVKKDGFERMRHNKKIIARAIHLHNEGLSLFQVKDHLWQHDGVKVTRKTISDWTKKYSVFLK
jgi:transposase-like protein